MGVNAQKTHQEAQHAGFGQEALSEMFDLFDALCRFDDAIP
jgi:hypothetical protein